MCRTKIPFFLNFHPNLFVYFFPRLSSCRRGYTRSLVSRMICMPHFCCCCWDLWSISCFVLCMQSRRPPRHVLFTAAALTMQNVCKATCEGKCRLWRKKSTDGNRFQFITADNENKPEKTKQNGVKDSLAFSLASF